MKSKEMAHQLKYNGDGPIEHRIDGSFKVWALPQAAAVLNRRFHKYPPETDFVAEGSEGVFEFQAKDLAFVEAVLSKLQVTALPGFAYEET